MNEEEKKDSIPQAAPRQNPDAGLPPTTSGSDIPNPLGGPSESRRDSSASADASGTLPEEEGRSPYGEDLPPGADITDAESGAQEKGSSEERDMQSALEVAGDEQRFGNERRPSGRGRPNRDNRGHGGGSGHSHGGGGNSHGGRQRQERRGREERSNDRGERERHVRPAPLQPVKREILANCSGEESRAAILENGRLVEMLWERKSAQNIVGNIYKGVVENVLPGISSAFVNIGFEKNAYLYISDVLGGQRSSIDQLIKKGQEIMVQVAKEAIGTKGMKVTMEVTLPGRYLVLTPFSTTVGISKQIEEPVERKRIADIVDRLAKEHLQGKGLVVRTEAEGASEDDLRREVQYLMRSWEALHRRYETQPAPCLLHKDIDLPMQVARDLLSDQVYVYFLDNREVYQNVLDFIGKISPDLKERVRYYEGKTPIFTAFNIEPEIEKIRHTKVQLPSGGTIVIQEAESLTAIDVNTGRFTGSKSQEETVTQNNLEAAQEVAQQLRLRNIGGIIVIDFIDMRKASNRQRVMEALQNAVRRDRAKIRILPITRLGLIEMTRERKRESTMSLMTEECRECRGSGRVLSAESLRIRIQREIHEITQGRPGGNVRIVLHPLLAEAFKGQQERIEKSVHRSVKVAADPHLDWEDYRIILE
ncbi:MAG: Rne/Rng family ribonuclease [Elusimicrobiota bacterium]|jgi:ribonuclease G